MEKFMKSINDVIVFILGEQRDGKDRRVKKTRKKNTRRTTQRRK